MLILLGEVDHYGVVSYNELGVDRVRQEAGVLLRLLCLA